MSAGSFEVGCPHCGEVVISLTSEELDSARAGWEGVLDIDRQYRPCTVLGASCLNCRRTITQKVPLRRPTTCPRCGGRAHTGYSTVITSPEVQLRNDRIERECEGRILDRFGDTERYPLGGPRG